MDNSDQDQSSNEVQFDSKHISANQSKREGDIKFQTRLTFKDKMKKFFDKPIMRGPRKYLWLAAALILIAGIVVGIIMLVNLNKGSQYEEGSDDWYSELDGEVTDDFNNDGDFENSLRKIDNAIENAKEKNNKDEVTRLYNEKGYIYTNRGKNEEAKNTYQELVNYLGDDATAESYSSLAFAQQQLGEKQAAIENYKKAIELYGDSEDANFTRALVKQLEEELAK